MTTSAVIIGTGAGGLATAASLAKRGFDVLALEQSPHLGGYLNPFGREGYQFDPGLHYVGEAGPGGRLRAVLGELGIDAATAFRELDPDGFDVYRFPDLEIRMCRGLDRYRERLEKAFPAERRGLARFFDLARALDRASRAVAPFGSAGWAERLRGVARMPALLRWQNKTFAELLAATIHDRRLRSILAAAGGDYGLPPSRAAALVGVGTITHYANGAFFPRGGSGALRDQLVAVAERHGARFRTEAPVARITTRDGRAIGVELEDGERIAADVVISDADPTLTFGRLLDPDSVPSRVLRKVNRTEPSMSFFAVYLGMRRDLREHGLGALQVWDYPQWDIDACYSFLRDGALPKEPILFLSPNSLKDEPGVLAPVGCSTLEIVTGMAYSMFERFRDRPLGHRGDDYQREKERISDWVLEAVEKRWPGLVGDVVVREASTPVTNESYTRAVRGSAYGPAMTPEQYGPRRFPTTAPVTNLFLVGSGVFGDGLLPCLGSGYVAAEVIARRTARKRVSVPRLRRPTAEAPA